MAQPRTAHTWGVFALVALAAIYGITAIMARYFSDEVGIFEQWYIRFAIAAVLLAIVFRRKIRFNKMLHASRRELSLVVFRGFVGFVIGAGLYAWAAQNAKIGSVAAMQALPTTALFGVLLLHEKISTRKASLIALAFAGALLMVVHNPSELSFGLGELASVVSGALFSLTFVLRKLQTGELNNYELSFITTVVGAVGNYIASVITYQHFLPSNQVLTLSLGSLFIGAAILSVCMSLLSSYGFEHVKATVASVILDMEIVFGAVLGYAFYREILSLQELLGAGIILGTVVIMNQINNREARELKAVPNPE